MYNTDIKSLCSFDIRIICYEDIEALELLCSIETEWLFHYTVIFTNNCRGGTSTSTRINTKSESKLEPLCKAIPRILLHLFTIAPDTTCVGPKIVHIIIIDNFNSVCTLEIELSVFCGNSSLVGSGGQCVPHHSCSSDTCFCTYIPAVPFTGLILRLNSNSIEMLLGSRTLTQTGWDPSLSVAVYDTLSNPTVRAERGVDQMT